MSKPRGKNLWTPELQQQLRNLYPDHRAQDVADTLGVTLRQVYQKAFLLGLKKSDAFKSSPLSGRGNQAKNQAGRFQPGHATWNKGARYDAGGRSAETRFKPGTKPHTTLPVGSYRTVFTKRYQQLEVKTSDATGPNHKRWTPVHRLVWERANGPVPAGHIVIFKSPALRTLVLEEITLDRLLLVSRAEHARRNHWQTRHPELGNLFTLKGAIKRQVNKIIKGARP